jgi:hypothetical protein
MGLYSVKWICDKLGYQISYKRNNKGFTEFTLTIPKEEAASDVSVQEDSIESGEQQLISA